MTDDLEKRLADAEAEIARLRGEVAGLTGMRNAARRRAEAAEDALRTLRERVAGLAAGWLDEAASATAAKRPTLMSPNRAAADLRALADAPAEEAPALPTPETSGAGSIEATPPAEQTPVGQEEARSRELGPCGGCGATWPDLHVYSTGPGGVLCVKCGWTPDHA